MFTIQEVAELLKVHPQTLRNWEKAGLVRVERVGVNRQRVYSDANLERLKKILHYSGKGISLRGIKELLHLSEEEG